jgi:Septum formation
MVAPAGVNEGIPGEPVEVGPAHAGPAKGKLAAVPIGKLAEAAPGQADLGETELTEAGHAEAELAGPELAGPELAGPELAGPELAEPELAEGKLTEGELAEAGPAEAELAGTDGPGWGAEESRDVSPLAVAGIILGIIALVGVAVGVLAVITHGFRPKTVITYRPAAVFGLRPGECVNSAGNGLNVTRLSCATPHDAEVFATFSLPEGAWPGASAVQQDAGNGCVNRFNSYLNPQLATADLTQEYVYPNRAAWQAGEHIVVCEVRAVSGQLTGSVRAQG